MKFSRSKTLLLWAAFALPAWPALGQDKPALKAALAGSGVEYSGGAAFLVDKDFKRGDWKGKKTAFRTLTAAAGEVRLRLELTKNISRAKTDRTMAERFMRVDALYAGGAAYPGMITTEFEVPEALRPREITAGGNKARLLAATPSMTYGAGAEDLVSQRGILGYIYCGGATLAQIELFFPKAGFDEKAALLEFDKLHCAAAPEGKVWVSEKDKKGK